jgi:hypothetical protein
VGLGAVLGPREQTDLTAWFVSANDFENRSMRVKSETITS